MTASNISAIKGKAKSKKTFLMSMFCGCLVSNNSMGGIIYPSVPSDKRSIVYIDTEQSEYDSWSVGIRIKTMSNTNADNFVPFSMRGRDSSEIIDLITYLLSRFPDISIIVIDQIADLVTSVNDEKEAVKLLKFIEKLTRDYKMHVSCVIHENPTIGNGKATGWIGTQILKKAESIITVTKDSLNKRIAHVSASDTRGEDFDDFSFEINEHGIPEILTDYQTESDI